LILNTDEEIIKIYTQSLFERLFELLDEVKSSGVRHTCSLTDQYRMISDISNFVRDKIYLPKVNLRCMVTRTPYNIAGYDNKAMVWIEAGKSLGRETKGHSKSRDCEAQIVLDQIRKLLALNIDIGSIGVITFYASQRDLIIQRLDTLGLTDDERHMLAIGTIDAFQGKEFDAVLFSCSRSNDMPADEVHLRQKVGFLNDDNRMCVALSRARNLLIGVGDSSTVQYASILGEYIKECKFGKGSCIIYG
jgi:superfamily I DNA and/or RNA helicase